MRFCLAAGFLGLCTGLIAQTSSPAPQPLVVLKGHSEAVYSVAAAPEGKIFATASFDKSIRLWDENGKELRVYAGKTGHTNLVVHVGFSPDGSQLATASSDNFVKIWDVPTAKPSLTLEHSAASTRVATSADGKFLAAGAADGSIRLWTTADNKLAQTFTGHAGPIQGLAFSANGQTLYSLGSDRTLRYWTTADGKPAGSVGAAFSDRRGFSLSPTTGQPIIAHADGSLTAWLPAIAAPKAIPPLAATPTAAAISDDGQLAVIATEDKKMQTIHLGTGTVGAAMDPLPALAKWLAVAQTGTGFAAGTADGRVHVYGPDGKLKSSFRAHAGELTSLAFYPGTSTLYSAGADGMVRVWPVAPLAAKVVAHPDKLTTALVLSDGKKVATGCTDKILRICTDGKIEKPLAGHEAAITALAETTGGGLLSADAAGQIFSWVVATGVKSAVVPAGPKAAVSALIPQPGSTAFAVIYASGEVVYRPVPVAREKEKGDEAKSFAHPAAVLAAAFSADNQKLLTIAADKKLRTWNLATAKADPPLDLAARPIKLAAFSADRSKLALVLADGANPQFVLRPLTGDNKPTLEVTLSGEPDAIAWSPNGLRLAVALPDGPGRRVEVFDTASGRLLQTVAEPAAPVKSLAFLMDNKTVAVAAEDKNLSLHDLAVTAAHTAGPGNAAALAIAPNTGHSYIAGADKLIRVWDPATQKEVKTFGPAAGPITRLAISRDGSTLLAGSGKQWQGWTIADAKPVALPSFPVDVVTIGFGPDKSRLLVGLADHTVVVYDLVSLKPWQFTKHAGSVLAASFHPRQPQFTSIAADKTLVLAPFAVVRGINDPAAIGLASAIVPSGSHGLTSGTDKGFAGINLGNFTKDKKFDLDTPATALAAARNNLYVAAAHGSEPHISLIHFNDGSVIGKFKTPVRMDELAFHPSHQALLGRGADNKLYAWTIAHEAGQPLPPEFGQLIQDYPHPVAARGFAFLGDGATVVSAADDKWVRLWKFASDAPARNLQHPVRVDTAAFDKTGTLVATGAADGQLRIWDISKPQPVPTKTIVAHQTATPTAVQHPIYAVAWSPDGKSIATGSFDRSVKIWDATAGTLVKELKPGLDRPPLPQEVREVAAAVVSTYAGLPLMEPPPAGHTDPVYTLAYSPDGKILATGSSDRTVKLWNPATGELLRTLENPNLKVAGDGRRPSHPGFVQCVKFSPDGSKVLSVGTAPRNGGYLATWNTATGQWLTGFEWPAGPIYSVAVRPDGAVLIGCGPKKRNEGDSEAILLPLNFK